MKSYFVNKNAQPNGDHEVHVSECRYFPLPENRAYLGTFSSCKEAVNESKRRYSQSNGCYHCCYECHSS